MRTCCSSGKRRHLAEAWRRGKSRAKPAGTKADSVRNYEPTAGKRSASRAAPHSPARRRSTTALSGRDVEQRSFIWRRRWTSSALALWGLGACWAGWLLRAVCTSSIPTRPPMPSVRGSTTRQGPRGQGAWQRKHLILTFILSSDAHIRTCLRFVPACLLANKHGSVTENAYL